MSEPTFHFLVRAIIEREGRFLLTRERGSAFCYLPGGHVEPGEAAATALSRELREELGIQARAGGFVGVIEHAWRDALGNPQQEINHLFRVSAGSLVGTEPASMEPHLEVLWCAPAAFERVDLRPEPARALLAGPAWQGRAWWASTLGGG